MTNAQLPEYVDGLPNICGSETSVADAMARPGPYRLRDSKVDFGRIRSAFAVALHMHQPLIPAGGSDLKTAGVVSNLQYMMENQGIGDNHNASVFHWCYKRMETEGRDLVWQGIYRDDESSPAKVSNRLPDDIKKLFSDFPPKKKK